MLHGVHLAIFSFFLTEVCSYFWDYLTAHIALKTYSIQLLERNTVNTNSLDCTACLVSPGFMFSTPMAALALK